MSQDIEIDGDPIVSVPLSKISKNESIVMVTQEVWSSVVATLQNKQQQEQSVLVSRLIESQAKNAQTIQNVSGGSLGVGHQTPLPDQPLGCGQKRSNSVVSPVAGGSSGQKRKRDKTVEEEVVREEDELSVYASDHLDEEQSSQEEGVDDLENLMSKNEEVIDELEEDEVMQYLNGMVDEDTGPEIAENLAKALKKVWEEEIKMDKLKDCLKSIKAPKNCTFAVTPQVNPEVFSMVQKSTQDSDKRSQRHQKLMVKSAIPIMNQLSTLSEVKPNAKKEYVLTADQMQQLKRNAMNSFTSLAQLNTDTIKCRSKCRVRWAKSLELTGLTRNLVTSIYSLRKRVRKW